MSVDAAVTVVTIPTVGRMQDFNPDDESITAYLERFRLFVSVNGIAEIKQAPALLVLGLKHYTLLRGLVSPGKPEDKILEELTTLLTKHYDSEPIVITERFHFYQRNQKSGESISEYLASLRNLASRCQFKDFLSEALRDRLVCGLNSEATQKSLLAKDDLTLDKALETALSMEAAAKRTRELKGSHRANPVLKVEPQTPPAQPCGRCGRGNHSSSACRFKGTKCHKCGKVGHIAPVCRSKPSQRRPKQAKWLAASEPSPSADSCVDQALFLVKDASSRPYKVEVHINGKPLIMEVDTGAGVSIASESVIASLAPSTELRKTKVMLKTYTVLGSITINVDYCQQQYTNLNILVVQGSGPSLERDWLKKIRLDWR